MTKARNIASHTKVGTAYQNITNNSKQLSEQKSECKQYIESLTTAKNQYQQDKIEVNLGRWAIACQDSEHFIQELEPSFTDKSKLIKIRKILIEHQWELHNEYLTKAEKSFRINKNLIFWKESYEGAKVFIDKVEPMSRQLDLTLQVKSWQNTLMGHNERMVKLSNDSQKMRDKAIPVMTYFTSPMLPATGPTLPTKPSVIKMKINDDLLPDFNLSKTVAAPNANQPTISAAHSINQSQNKDEKKGDVTLGVSKKKSQKKKESRVKVATSIPVMKNSGKENKLKIKTEDSFPFLENEANEDNKSCCSCWSVLFKRKKQDSLDDSYAYQPLPSSPKKNGQT